LNSSAGFSSSGASAISGSRVIVSFVSWDVSSGASSVASSSSAEPASETVSGSAILPVQEKVLPGEELLSLPLFLAQLKASQNQEPALLFLQFLLQIP